MNRNEVKNVANALIVLQGAYHHALVNKNNLPQKECVEKYTMYENVINDIMSTMSEEDYKKVGKKLKLMEITNYAKALLNAPLNNETYKKAMEEDTNISWAKTPIDIHLQTEEEYKRIKSKNQVKSNDIEPTL